MRTASPLPRSRGRRSRAAFLALAALALRAVIPPGFMPVATADGLAIEFCPGAGALPPGLVHAHHHHGHGGSGGREDSSAVHHAPCLFAASQTLASAPLLGPLPQALALGRDLDERRHDAQLHSPSIVRAQSPRAPPVRV